MVGTTESRGCYIGGNIINVLRYACLKAVNRMPQEIRMDDILQGIQRERHKDGKFTAPV